MNKVIFFDMGNTLLDFHRGISDEEKDKIGLERMISFLKPFHPNPKLTFESIWDDFYQPMLQELSKREILHHEIPVETYLDPFLEKYSLQLNEIEKIELMKIQFSFFAETVFIEPGLHEILAKLKDENYKLAILSNVGIYPEIFIDVFKQLDLRKYFEHCFFSYSARTKKPESEFFHYALRTMDVSPTQAIMVGDKVWYDIAPAKKLGLTTVWIQSAFTFCKEDLKSGEKYADYTISSIVELEQICRS